MSTSRQLAAIMFTDIVGYTAIMGKDSDKALELVGANLSRAELSGTIIDESCVFKKLTGVQIGEINLITRLHHYAKIEEPVTDFIF